VLLACLEEIRVSRALTSASALPALSAR